MATCNIEDIGGEPKARYYKKYRKKIGSLLRRSLPRKFPDCGLM